MPSPTSLPEWQALKTHQTTLANVHMKDLFAQDTQRFQKMSLSAKRLFY